MPIAIFKENIRQLALKDMREGIDKVITEGGSFCSNLISMYDASTYLERNGWESQDDFDSNGWQADMWQTFKKEGATIYVSAQGYYGGVTVSLEE